MTQANSRHCNNIFAKKSKIVKKQTTQGYMTGSHTSSSLCRMAIHPLIQNASEIRRCVRLNQFFHP